MYVEFQKTQKFMISIPNYINMYREPIPSMQTHFVILRILNIQYKSMQAK